MIKLNAQSLALSSSLAILVVYNCRVGSEILFLLPFLILVSDS